MSQYRLHIDIPIGTSEPEAVRVAQHLISSIATHVQFRSKIDEEVNVMNYRLGHDEDRQKSIFIMAESITKDM